MQYVLLFLEGIVTFISPCLLPMLPVFLIYFAGQNGKPVLNAGGFVLGFTAVFVALGAFAGFAGGFLLEFSTAVNIVTGGVVVLFGLGYIGVLNLGFLRRLGRAPQVKKIVGFPSAFMFGVVFAVTWTPCISVFLGAALLRASAQGHMAEGMLMLFVYSMGLGLPFIASAVLLDRLKNAFAFIKRHYRVINIFSGAMLILVGVLMMAGVFGRFAAIFGGAF